MKRSLTTILLAAGITALAAGPASAQPITEPASCQGYLASYANPNYAFIVHELVKPVADDLGVTQGQLLSAIAQQHNGGLEACIPE